MKKLFFLLSILLLTSCSLFKTEERISSVTEAEIKIEEKIGIISDALDQELEAPPTSFVLLSDAGERTFIESLSINLKKYKRRRVKVEGKWNNEKTLFVVENLTKLGQETLAKNLYQNAELGIKFTYPSIWEIKEVSNQYGVHTANVLPYEVSENETEISFESSNEVIAIERLDNPSRLSSRVWLHLDEEYKSLPLPPPGTGHEDTKSIFQKSAVGVALLDAVKRTEESRVEFYVQRDTFIYRFGHNTLSDSDKDIYRNAFYDLVASFEFIPFAKGTRTVTPIVTETPVMETPTVAPLQKKDDEIVLKEGMTLLDAKHLKIKIQYPKNWYWRFFSATGRYQFSNKDVTDDNVLLSLYKSASSWPGSSVAIPDINGRKAFKDTADGLQICVNIENSKEYSDDICLLSEDNEYEDIMKQMLETVQE